MKWRKSSYSGSHNANCVEVAEDVGGSNDRTWRKSSYSAAENANCVEVAEGPRTHIRDTQHRHLTTLTFPADSWRDFIAGVKSDDM